MKKVLFTLFFILYLSVHFMSAQQYGVAFIPDSLKTNAKMVVRLDHNEYHFVSKTKLISKIHYVATIFNEEANYAAHVSDGYDKHKTIKQMSATVYNADGMKIKEVKLKDFTDVSAFDGYSIYSDNRVKFLDLTQAVFPYTIEYTVEAEHKSSFGSHAQTIVPGEAAVMDYGCTIRYPADNDVLLKTYFMDDVKPIHTTDKTDKIITIKAQNVKSSKPELYSESRSKRFRFALKSFQIDSYQGEAQDWQSFGKFILLLNKDRDKLPTQIVDKVNEIIASAPDEKAKVAALYKFLQSTTRYVSVQYGVGGYQPFYATDVAETGYGDCKALSNYMYALLKQANITSHYTLINAGDDAKEIEPEFIASQFNHAILCVPNKGDTIWLECTSQRNPFGYQGSFTGNRKALIIKEDGGHLVSTAKYTHEDNVSTRKILVDVAANGNASAKINGYHQGLRQEEFTEGIMLQSKEQAIETLGRYLDVPSFTLENFNYKSEGASMPFVNEDLSIKVSFYAQVTGSRMFIVPNMLNKTSQKITPIANKSTPFHLHNSFTLIDTVIYNLPAGYKVESLPKAVNVKNKFGEYSTMCVFENNSLKYIRRKVQHKGEYPAEDFNLFVKYNNDLYAADRAKAVLVKI
jgi:hypothetical protein